MQKTLDNPSTKVKEVLMIESMESWMTLIIKYLTKKNFQEGEVDVEKIRRLITLICHGGGKTI